MALSQRLPLSSLSLKVVAARYAAATPSTKENRDANGATLAALPNILCKLVALLHIQLLNGSHSSSSLGAAPFDILLCAR